MGGGERIWIEQRVSLDPTERERAVSRTISRRVRDRIRRERERSSAREREREIFGVREREFFELTGNREQDGGNQNNG